MIFILSPLLFYNIPATEIYCQESNENYHNYAFG